MKKIYKYPFRASKTVVIEMPAGATILPYVAAAAHEDLLVIWAEVDEQQQAVDRVLRVVGTGWELPEQRLEYIGTTLNGPLVWHVYEQLPEDSEEEFQRALLMGAGL